MNLLVKTLVVMLSVLVTGGGAATPPNTLRSAPIREGVDEVKLSWYQHYVSLASQLNKTLSSKECPPSQLILNVNTGVPKRTPEKRLDDLDLDRELARQNRITEQIVANYLEKRLLRRPSRPAPSVWEILPRARRRPAANIQEALNRTDRETLESGETEPVPSVYGEEFLEDEGMSLKSFLAIILYIHKFLKSVLFEKISSS